MNNSLAPLTMSRDLVGWETAERLVHELRHYDEGRSGLGSKPTPARLICSTIKLMERSAEAGHSPPDRVYSLPDGNVMLEWNLPGGGMKRVEIEGEGHGQIMITRPGTRAEFIDFEWKDATWWRSKGWGDWKLPRTDSTTYPDSTPTAVAPTGAVSNSYTLAA